MTDVTQILSQIEDGDPHAAGSDARGLIAEELAREPIELSDAEVQEAPLGEETVQGRGYGPLARAARHEP